MKIDVYNSQGSKAGHQVELLDSVFGISVNEHAMYLAVKQYLANQRQGTHKSRERSEIRGSRKKLYRQKGTGNARKGDIKSPILRGGGRVFGPKPRDYSFKLNKKVKALARNSALSSKLAAGEVKVVENLAFDAPKTSVMKGIIDQLKDNRRKVLLVTDGYKDSLTKSANNIPGLEILTASNINTYQVLNGDLVLLEEGAVATVNELCSKYSKN